MYLAIVYQAAAFKNISKTDQPLVMLTKGKEPKSEKRVIATDPMDI